MTTHHQAEQRPDVLTEALQRQADGDDHDRGLIVERIGWTPEQRLDAHSAFLRFYQAIRPNGPLVGG